jgi:peptide/nickel transport system substrate-binding protein
MRQQELKLIKNYRLQILAAAFAVATLAGASAASAQDRQPSEQCPAVGGTLKFARTADVAEWYHQLDNPSIWAWPLVNLPLVTDNADASALVGAAAETWEASDDSTVFTFHLRQGLKFSNGADVTSADVIDSFQRAMDDPQGNLKTRFPEPTFAAPDAATFVITLADTYPAFLQSAVSGIGIYPKGSDPAAMGINPISSGPFMLAEWRKGQVAKLVRNPHYWNQPYPCVDGVDMMVVGDPATQALQLQAGQIDIAQELPPAQLASLATAPGVKIQVFPSLAEELIRLQRVTQPAFADINVRKAMNYAIDKKAIASAVFFGTAIEQDSEMPRTLYYVPQTPYTYDVEKAKALMAQSAFPTGFTTQLVIASNDPLESGIATVVKDQLGKIGITVNIQQVEAGTKLELRSKREFEMFLATTSADQIDPESFWEFCCAAGFGLGSAWTDYNNPDVISQFAEVKKTAGAKRGELFAQMQKEVWDDAAQLYLVFIDAPMGLRANVKGFTLPPTRHHYLDTVYKAN